MDASRTAPDPTGPADGAPGCREELLGWLRPGAPRPGRDDDARIRGLIERLEHLQPADLTLQPSALAGVWELRWSSSSLPYLATQPWLENLQMLDPPAGRAMNLLRLAGPLGPLAGIGVQAEIAIAPEPPHQRVTVRFERGGWLGPRIGERRLQLFRDVRQNFPAWLDVTVLDDDLRVSRGNAGTLFALLRRPDLDLAALLP
ncbi:PAP/fibrillin family protein [Synechococcus sp. CCY 9618]|uniref:PAP/fibrillin family protein n=1 Tax=Synechococcus sp. CCY 9618 TaxID=2815602 RepID=UPI001C24A37F|nr:PAP/fibrillin family protein [Synechococcus sp. CCY 9618]